jgi:hypothetical protein
MGEGHPGTHERHRARVRGDPVFRILTYRSLDDDGSVLSVPPRVFAEHMRWLHERGFGPCRSLRWATSQAPDGFLSPRWSLPLTTASRAPTNTASPCPGDTDLPEGCTNPDSCRGLVVFVQQPAEQVPPIHVASSGAGDRRQLTLSLRRV